MRLACLLFLGSLLTIPNYAQSSPCSLAINDEAGALGNPDHKAQVQRAIDKLSSLGADVKVYSEEWMSSRNLDIDIDHMVKDCPEWQAPAGGMKGNLIVFAFTVMDHKAGLYSGPQWRDVIRPNWPGILAKKVGPLYHQGEYYLGLVAGMEEVASLIKTPPAVTAQVVNQATDFSGLWTVLFWLVLIVSIFLCVYMAYRIYLAFKQEKEEITGAQQAAIVAKEETSSAIVRLGSPDALDFAPDEESKKKAKLLIDLAMESYKALNEVAATDPHRKGLTVSQYQLIDKRYTSILEVLNRAQMLLEGRPEESASVPSVKSTQRVYPRSMKHGHDWIRTEEIYYNTLPVVPPSPVIVEHSPIVIVDQPVVYHEPVVRDPEPPAPSYTPDPEPSGGSTDYSSSSSPDSYGGSSDYSSSSSDSGSSFDSGGSTNY